MENERTEYYDYIWKHKLWDTEKGKHHFSVNSASLRLIIVAE